jgi:hypothetical protein
MFCRNCGKETPNQGEFCMSCGAKPLAGNSFCPACSAPTTPLSEICVKCGTRLIPQSVASGTIPQVAGVNPKSKTASILLAVFLGFWTWLYTYKKDHWKFWVSLGISIVVGIGLGIAMSWFVIAGINSFDSLDASAIGFIIAYILAIIVSFGLWVWSVVDTAIKKDEWYTHYPMVNK